MRKLWLLLLFSLMISQAFAQFTSNVAGTVTDPKGAVVSGATVTLTNTSTNINNSMVTGTSGQYHFNRLAPGSYAITVDAAGFKKTVRHVTLTTDQTSGVDMQLQMGQASESVTVTEEGAHDLNPEETRTQYTLTAREIEEFPVQNQATLGLLKTAPGATGISENHVNVNINQDQASEAANGRPNTSNLFVLDSIPINSELMSVGGAGGAVDFVPQPDMIQEISLQTTTFSVENGASTGIQTSITTKSGTNKFHGDVDYSYSGKPLEATPNPLTTKPNYRSQQVGLSLGGPIWKDRTFFFGSYFNQQYSRTNAQATEYVDPAFVAWAQANYPTTDTVTKALVPVAKGLRADLAHSRPTASGALFANNGGGDWIDGGACSGSGTPLVPCNIPVLSSSFFTAPQTDNGSQYNFRLDHTFNNSKDRIYLSFFRFDQKSISRRINPLFDGQTPSTGYYAAANYTHQFSSTLLNQASFGQTRFAFDYKPMSYSQEQVELPYNTGPFEFGGDLRAAFLEREFEHQSYGRDSLSWVKGKHNFSFGFEGSYQNEIRDNSQTYSRPFYESTFNLPAFLANTAQFELLYTLSADVNYFPGKFIPQLFGAGNVRFGAFAQDSWKVTPSLLLTYGFRWDDFGNPSTYGKNTERFANVKLPGEGTLQQRVSDLSVGVVKNVYSSRRNANFLPRAGFAYTLPGSQNKTVIHGGLGLYQDDLNLEQVAANIPTQAPVRLSLTLYPFAPYEFGSTTVQGPPGGSPYGFTFSNFAPIVIAGYTKKGAPVDPSGKIIQGNDLYGVDPNLKPQSTFIYNVGVEQELPRHMVVGLLYSGSHGFDQLVNTNVNTYAGRGSNPTINTDFAKIKFFRNAGVSNYNALIATVRQNIGKLTYQASYTYGVSKADPSQNLTDQYDVHSQYTYTNSDTRHRLTLTQVYEVPAHFQSRLLNEVLGGWNISNTLITQSGQPFSAEAANQNDSGSFDYNNDGVIGDIPAYTGSKHNFSRSDARKSIRTATSLFPAGSFVAPPANTEGGLQNIFRGPGYFDLDTGLSKKIRLAERASLTLRLQGINILNVANFQNPDGELGDNTFGVVQNSYNARTFQFGARLQF